MSADGSQSPDDNEWRVSGSQVRPDWRYSDGNYPAQRPICLPVAHSFDETTPKSGGEYVEQVQAQLTQGRASYQIVYVEDAQRGVAAARRAYWRLMRLYWALRITAIIAGVSIAAMATSPAPRWILGVLGALGAAAEGVLGASNLQERAVVRGALADGISRELREYTLGIGDYASPQPLATLTTRVEGLRAQASTARFRLDRVEVESTKPKPAD